MKSSLEQALQHCQTGPELHEFLVDLLTPAELIEFEQRRQIAQLLHQGLSYKLIETQTGASSTTIARVSKALHRDNSGYKHLIEEL